MSDEDDPTRVGCSSSLPSPYFFLTIRSARYGPCEERHRRDPIQDPNRPDHRGRAGRWWGQATPPTPAAASSSTPRPQTQTEGRQQKVAPPIPVRREGRSRPREVGDEHRERYDSAKAEGGANRTTTGSSNMEWTRRWTRDVTRIVADCLRGGPMHFVGNNDNDEEDEDSSSGCRVRLRSVNRDGMRTTLIPIEWRGDDDVGMGGAGGRMNVAFGDPCPGTTKRLHVEYTISETTTTRPAGAKNILGDDVGLVHRMSFAEQEPVVLRRHFVLHHDNTSRQPDKEMEPGDSVPRELDMRINTGPERSNVLTTGQIRCNGSERNQRVSVDFSAAVVAEPVLPLVLPWLTLSERVACRQVCGRWRTTLQTWGLATTLDNNSLSTFDDNNDNGLDQQLLTVPVLRGLLLHSSASLQSLYVSGMSELQQCDLHPALASMKRLRAVDISYCTQLGDETLHVLSSPTGSLCETLQVLYVKGLRKTTDAGLVSLSSCHNLRVLDVSDLPQMTDDSGTCLGQCLVELRAWYGRDNYRLTRRTVEALVTNCPHLEQLTLWGCHRLEHLHPFAFQRFSSSHHPLVLLNLWGCHSLTDDAAQALVNMSQLRTLIVSECHKLTDQFVFSICQQAPQLQHLLMRYCPRITDAGVRTIAHTLKSLFSLDLSCCPLVTSDSLAELLLLSCTHLVELRIARCRSLDLVTRPNIDRRYRHHPAGELGEAGNELLKALRRPECRLALLDVSSGFPGDRGHHLTVNQDQEDDELQLFASAVESLGFTQGPVGFFARHCH